MTRRVRSQREKHFTPVNAPLQQFFSLQRLKPPDAPSVLGPTPPRVPPPPRSADLPWSASTILPAPAAQLPILSLHHSWFPSQTPIHVSMENRDPTFQKEWWANANGLITLPHLPQEESHHIPLHYLSATLKTLATFCSSRVQLELCPRVLNELVLACLI